jgi:hypothetical protein
MPTRLFYPAFALWCLAAGCLQQNPMAESPPRTVRIIIKFAQPAEPAAPQLLKELGQILHCSLIPLQRLANNAQVYACDSDAQADTMTARLADLNTHQAIEYAEIDAKRRSTN